MSKDLYEHDFEVDLTEKETSYVMDDVQTIYINDINQQNYPTGFINWTNVSVVGSTVNKQYSWSNARISIPYTVAVIPDGTNLIVTPHPTNTLALSVKSYLNMIDWISIKFNGVQCNRGSYYANLYNNEKMKEMGTDEYKIYGDMLCHSWDTANSLQLSSVSGVGEMNNITGLATSLIGVGFKPDANCNTGHLNRCKITNTDFTKTANSTMAQFYGTDNGLLNHEYQPGLVYQGNDGLVYQGIAEIPLSLVHPFFAEMPSVASSTGFELRLQMNCAKENDWTVQYGAADPTSKVAKPTGMVINQVIGHTCPFLLSNPSTDGISGLCCSTANATGTLKIKSCIGWNTTGLGMPAGFSTGNTAPPCRIYIPAVNFTGPYIKKIIEHPQYTLKYKDYYIDYDMEKKQQNTVSRLFNVQLSKVRTLYIIPFLSAKQDATAVGGVNIACPAHNSPLSSAPNTSSPCVLKNFNIQIGGSNIFIEPQAFSSQFYNNNFLSLMAKVNGNSLKSNLFSGQITKSMWESGAYRTYRINLEKVSDEVQDSLMKSFQLIYTIDGTLGLSYDMYYVIDYESVLEIDRATGTITPFV